MTESIFPGFENRMVSVGDQRISVHVGGSGTPLLLLHGYPQNHAAWIKLADPLSKTFTCLIADLPGYGASSIPVNTPDHEGFSKRRMASLLLSAMASMGYATFSVMGVLSSIAMPKCRRQQALSTLGSTIPQIAIRAKLLSSSILRTRRRLRISPHLPISNKRWRRLAFWIPEIGEHAVAEILGDHAVEGLDLSGAAGVERSDDFALFLGIKTCREHTRPHHVTEQDGQLAAFRCGSGHRGVLATTSECSTFATMLAAHSG